MSLPFSNFKSALETVFNDMSGDDRKFADGFAAAVKAYAEHGDIATADAGTISAGAFSGAGEGGITVEAADCAAVLYAGTQAMAGVGGNGVLAASMAEGVDAMIANGKVTTSVTGTCAPPSGSPFTMTGTAGGTMAGVPAPMEAAFFAAFEAMNAMREGNNAYMAAQCAAIVDGYLTAAVVTTAGEDALSGSAGTGKIS
jgi:hypothetical protein